MSENFAGENVTSDANSLSLISGTYFDFALVTPDSRPDSYRMREIGVTCSGRRGEDDNKSLTQAKFLIGDYLDINITTSNTANNRKPDQRGGDRDRERDRGGDRRDRGRPY